MASSQYESLEAALAQAGASTHWSKVVKGASLEATGPISTLLHTKASAKPYLDLLLAALPRLAGSEQEMIVRLLSERGMPKAGPILASMMRAAPRTPDGADAWAIGNALATIRDPATFDAVIELCTDRQLGAGRQMLFGLLPHIGKQSAYEAAIAALDDDTVRGHAIDAVGRFGRPKDLTRIKKLVTKNGLYETKAKAAAIRRLERAAARPSTKRNPR